MSLKTVYNDAIVDEAWRNSRVFIMGNNAQKGGGIASNADIVFPGNPKDYKLSVEKIWDTSVESIPESIKVNLFIGDSKYDDAILSNDNNWKHTFINLPFSKEELDAKGISYVIEEENLSNYKVISEFNYVDDYNQTFTLTNYNYHQIEVEKKWNQSITNIPTSIKIYLLKDGERVKDGDGNDRFLELSNDNNWTGVFDNLDPISLTLNGIDSYSIEEESLDYILQITKDNTSNISFTIGRLEITNDYGTIYSQYPSSEPTTNIDINVYLNGELVDTQTQIINRIGSNTLEVQFSDISLPQSTIPIKVNYVLNNGEPFPLDQTSYDINITGDETNGYQINIPKLSDEGDLTELIYLDSLLIDNKYKLIGENFNTINHQLDLIKIWNAKENEIPNELNVEVYKNNELYKTVLLNKENNWKESLIDLPGYQGEEQFEYRVVEEKLIGFKETIEMNKGILIKNLNSTINMIIDNQTISSKQYDLTTQILSDPLLNNTLNSNYRYVLSDNDEIEIIKDGGLYTINIPKKFEVVEIISFTITNEKETPITPQPTPTITPTPIKHEPPLTSSKSNLSMYLTITIVSLVTLYKLNKKRFVKSK